MNLTSKSFSPSYFEYLAASISTYFETLILAPTEFKALLQLLICSLNDISSFILTCGVKDCFV